MLLTLLHRWRREAGQAGRNIKRIVVAFEAGRDPLAEVSGQVDGSQTFDEDGFAYMRIFADHRSGNCDKVRFTVDHLRLPYEWIEIDSVKGGTTTPEFLAMNAQGQVPVAMLPDGRVLAQSNAIVRYVSDGSPLLPTDSWKRAKIDEWMFWEANNHEYFVAGCITHMTYMAKSKETRDPVRVQRAERALDIMENHLQVANRMVADELTAADIALLAYTRQAHLGGFDMNARPRLRGWVVRCEAALGLQPV